MIKVNLGDLLSFSLWIKLDPLLQIRFLWIDNEIKKDTLNLAKEISNI